MVKTHLKSQRKGDGNGVQTRKPFLRVDFSVLGARETNNGVFFACWQGQLPKRSNCVFITASWMQNVSAYSNVYVLYLSNTSAIKMESKDISLAMEDHNLPTAIAQEVWDCKRSAGASV